jgi:N-acetylglucosaminyldiphosphoundecaprenol N-acetyl-beta-D-mannosaminyltransferase
VSYAGAANERVRIGALGLDPVSFRGAVDAIERLVAAHAGGAVFTPNVDHVVLAEYDPRFRGAYARADLCVADGRIVVWAAELLGSPLPGKVSGSDLVWPLLRRASDRGWRVYLLGGGRGVAERAAAEMRRRLPELRIVGVAAPAIDMSEPAARRDPVVAEIRRVRPDLVLVALGAPKQELFIDEAGPRLGASVLLGLGATLDFVAGTVRRCPRWVSSIGLEWLFRLAREPRRLWRRYLVRDPAFFLILLRQLMGLGRLRAGTSPR